MARFATPVAVVYVAATRTLIGAVARQMAILETMEASNLRNRLIARTFVPSQLRSVDP
jgi:hypothetical protein